jgi:hypothetical protein
MLGFLSLMRDRQIRNASHPARSMLHDTLASPRWMTRFQLLAPLSVSRRSEYRRAKSFIGTTHSSKTSTPTFAVYYDKSRAFKVF